jgi:hypothetical protein
MSVRFSDYLLMRTPSARLAAPKAATPGQISAPRIAVSIFGLIAGIFLSFIVTGLDATPKEKPSASSPAADGKAVAQAPQEKPHPRLTVDLSWQRLFGVGIVTLVICGLTYQGLYFSLRLYQNEPGILIFFVSFQYGYFWQSAVEGARIVLAGTTGAGG